MQTPIHIDFQGMDPLDRLREKIEDDVMRLEARYGRVTSCRVVLKSPGNRHRTGAPYEVSIHLSLPNGKDINIDQARHADERFADANFALHDAFRRARRRLQEEARRLRGEMKAHEAYPVATVRQLADDFGFLEAGDGGGDIYFHRNSVLNGGFAQLKPGSRVSFAEEAADKGRRASTVRLLGKHGLR
jgi:cold shock CspA family protein/ribosome-associated translation inhibitor RaiA